MKINRLPLYMGGLRQPRGAISGKLGLPVPHISSLEFEYENSYQFNCLQSICPICR